MIGSGAVGGTIAALLHAAGHDVEVTARGAHGTAIAEGGLRLHGAWGEHLARVTASDTLQRTPELAIVATKAQDAPVAVEANLDRLGGVPLVIVQNGLGAQQLADVAPDSPLVVALATFAASYLSPGEITVTAAGPTVLGAPAVAGPASVVATSRSALALAAATLGAVMPVVTTDDLEGAQWTKLLVNHVNALPAITGRAAQEVIADRRLRRLMTASMRESVRVARALGVRFAPVQGLDGRILAVVGRGPLVVGQWLPRLMARRMGAVPNPGSTLQSLRRGQLTEIDHLNGAVVEAGVRADVPTPINAALVDMVHEVERTGRFLDTDEVLRRVS